MKYCYFCRESFEDEMSECPLCGDALADTPPDEDEEDFEESGDVDETLEPDAEMQGELVPVVIVRNEDDLRAAAGVLTEHGIDFEIDQADRRQQVLGTVLGKPAWRLLVKPDEGPEAFLRLANALPQLFPKEVTEAMKREREEHPDESTLAARRVVEILESPGATATGGELAKNIVTAFAGEDTTGIARAQYALVRRGQDVAGLLGEIAGQAVADGGDGVERVLYNVLEILEATGDTRTLAKIEPLFASPTPQVRARAAYAAGRLGAPASVDGLIELLKDDDEEVRYEASEAIWRLTGLDFDFDPYVAVELEKGHVEALRDAWERSGKRGLVRNKVSLAALLAMLGESM